MIQELYDALIEAKVSEEKARKASEALLKNWIDNSDKWKYNIYMEYINPLEKDRFSLRGDINLLNERVIILGERMDNLAEVVRSNNEIIKYGFGEFEKRFQAQNEQMKFGFEQSDKRLIGLSDQIKFGFEQFDKRLIGLSDQMKFGFEQFDKRLIGLSDQMKFGFEQMNKRLSFLEKLIFGILGMNFSLLIKLVFFSNL